MTDVRAPETDPFDPAAEREDQPRPGPSSPGSAFGLADWLKWVWRQLTSMRIALILLFLLALASVPGSMLPQQGGNPSGVQQYYTSHPALAPWLSRLGLFNVFAAPWFAAIYLLLFASLVGCVVPRTFRLAGSARTLPPRAPRHLARLPRSAEYSTSLPPRDAVEVAARVLSGRGFRLRRPDGADSAQDWVSAEKGYLREAGNLLFHLALLGVLVSVALGGLFGYKADRLLVQGQSFADTVSALDEWHPGRFVTAADLGPFTMTLNRFDARYITSGEQRGQPVRVRRAGHLHRAAGRPGAHLRPGRQPPAVGRRREGVPDRTRVRAGVHGHRRPRRRGVQPAHAVRRGHVGELPVRGRGEGVRRPAGTARLHRRLRADRGGRRRHAGVGVSRGRQSGGQPDRLRREPGHGQRPLAVRLPAGHQRHAPADGQPAGACAGPVAEASGRPGHDHVHRLRPLGEPGHHARPGSAARPDLRHRRPRRAAALVHDPPQAGLRPRPRRLFDRGSKGRDHGAGRRPGPHGRQRRLRGGIRHAGGRAEVRSRASRPRRQPASNSKQHNTDKRESEGPCPSTLPWATSATRS